MTPIAFQSSPVPSLGMEMEFQLLDGETLDLMDGILPLLDELPNNPLIKPEFNQCAAEIVTPVCSGMQMLADEAVTLLHTLKQGAEALGMRLCGAATHPFSTRLSAVTPMPRYSRLESSAGYLGRAQPSFALHVHIGMPSGDEAIRVMALLKPYLPLLTALSANSPYWAGHDTGFASFRLRLLAAQRSYGVPPTFRSWKQFSEFYRSTQRFELFDAFRDIHWDLRPRPDLGTLEVRIMDMQPSLTDALAMAGLVHVLAVYLLRSGDQAPLLPPQRWWIDKDNHFQASSAGPTALYIIEQRGERLPMGEIAVEVLEQIAPLAQELGNAEYLTPLRVRLDTGPGYARQREIYGRSGSLKRVVAFLVEALEDDLGQRLADRSRQRPGLFYGAAPQ